MKKMNLSRQEGTPLGGPFHHGAGRGGTITGRGGLTLG